MSTADSVMVDLETLDTAAGATIISIGAVKFDLNSDLIEDGGFYASVSVESNLAAGRTISESTLCWWLQQSAEAQAVFHEPKQSVQGALDSFTEWFGNSTFIWSNGADFDVAILTHAYRQQGWDVPWQFWNVRCVRTYKNLPGMKGLPVAVNPLKHNALADAYAQARLVQAIQRKLMAAGHPMVKAS